MENGSFLTHLEELRKRILISLGFVLILTPAAWFFSGDLITIFKNTFYPPELGKLYYFTPLELFFLRLKVSLFTALIAALPAVFWNLWVFIAPALRQKERVLLWIFTFGSTLLFLTGTAFALFAIFPLVMKYSAGMATPEIVPFFNIGSVIGIAVFLMLGFGISFQLPVLAAVLVKCDIVPLQTLKKARPYVIVLIFIAAAFLTPPDFISQLAMAIPAVALFELSLLFLSLSKKTKN